MRVLKKNFLFPLLLIGSLLPAQSNDDIGDTRLGLKYAQKNCSSCHGVLKEETISPNPKSVPFTILAQTPGITRTSLGVFLQTSHSTMPNLIVKGEDADNLISYILSLNKRLPH